MSQGYPDFLRVENRIAAPIVRLQGESFAATRTYGPLYVGNYPELMIWANYNGVPPALLIVNDLASEDLGDGLANTTYALTPGALVALQRPVNSPWIRVDLQSITAGTQVWDLAVIPTTNEHAQSPILSPRVLYSATNMSVAAGSTITQPINWVAPGPAVLHFQGSTVFNPNIQYLDTGGNWDSLFPYTGTDMGGTYTDHIVLPESSIRLQFHNTDGAASHGYSAVLMRE